VFGLWWLFVVLTVLVVGDVVFFFIVFTLRLWCVLVLRCCSFVVCGVGCLRGVGLDLGLWGVYAVWGVYFLFFGLR